MITFIVLVSIAAYFFIGGVIGRIQYVRVRRNCPEWQSEQETGRRSSYSFERCEPDDHPSAFLLGAFWPVGFPFVLGMQVGDYIASSDERKEAKRKKLQEDYDKAVEMLKDLNVDWDVLRGNDR